MCVDCYVEEISRLSVRLGIDNWPKIKKFEWKFVWVLLEGEATPIWNDEGEWGYGSSLLSHEPSDVDSISELFNLQKWSKKNFILSGSKHSTFITMPID